MYLCLSKQTQHRGCVLLGVLFLSVGAGIGCSSSANKSPTGSGGSQDAAISSGGIVELAGWSRRAWGGRAWGGRAWGGRAHGRQMPAASGGSGQGARVVRRDRADEVPGVKSAATGGNIVTNGGSSGGSSSGGAGGTAWVSVGWHDQFGRAGGGTTGLGGASAARTGGGGTVATNRVRTIQSFKRQLAVQLWRCFRCGCDGVRGHCLAALECFRTTGPSRPESARRPLLPERAEHRQRRLSAVRGIGWYRKHFTLDQSLSGRQGLH